MTNINFKQNLTLPYLIALLFSATLLGQGQLMSTSKKDLIVPAVGALLSGTAIVTAIASNKTAKKALVKKKRGEKLSSWEKSAIKINRWKTLILCGSGTLIAGSIFCAVKKTLDLKHEKPLLAKTRSQQSAEQQTEEPTEIICFINTAFKSILPTQNMFFRLGDDGTPSKDLSTIMQGKTMLDICGEDGTPSKDPSTTMKGKAMMEVDQTNKNEIQIVTQKDDGTFQKVDTETSTKIKAILKSKECFLEEYVEQKFDSIPEFSKAANNLKNLLSKNRLMLNQITVPDESTPILQLLKIEITLANDNNWKDTIATDNPLKTNQQYKTTINEDGVAPALCERIPQLRGLCTIARISIVEKGEAQKEVKVIVSPEDSPPSVLKKIKDLQERLKNSSDQFVPFP